VDPEATAVARPLELIVATAVFAAAQVAVVVTFAVDLSLYVAVAVNCSVAPAARLSVPGDTEIAVSVFAVTVTVVAAEMLPCVPAATTVYVVVAVGLTTCVPPLDGKVYELPSVPVIVTWVAFVATTVRVDELPGEIEAGLAVMLTAGFATEPTVRFTVVYAASPQWSHSSTTVCSAPAARLRLVFNVAASTT
jgi:hypothetical protein